MHASKSQARLVGWGRIQLICSLPSLQVVDDLQNVAAVLVLSRREANLLVPFDVVEQIVINGLEGFIEDLEMVSGEHIGQLFDVFKVPVSVLGQSITMVLVIPSRSNRVLVGNTVFAFLVLEALIDLLEFFFGGLQSIAGVSFVLGCVRRISEFLGLEKSLLLFNRKGRQGESLDNSRPSLTNSHLVSTQVGVLSVHPVKKNQLFLVSMCETEKLASKNDDSVLLFSWSLGNKSIDILEHLAVQGLSSVFGSVVVDSSVNEVKLSLEDAVGGLFGQRFGDNIDEVIRFHLGVLDHFEETSPYQGSAEDVADGVDVVDEEFQGDLVNGVLGEGVIFKVQQNCLVALRSIINSGGFFLRENQDLDDINAEVLLEKGDLDLVQTKRRMLRSVRSLLDGNGGIVRMISWIPCSFDNVQRCLLEPHFPPLGQSELVDDEVLLHVSKEVFNSSIVPLVFMEVFTQGFREVLLLHQEKQLLHGGCTLGVSDSVEDGVSNTGIGNWPSDGMGCDHLILVISPSFSLQEGSHA